MKILIAPDKFKGSLSSKEVCAAIHSGIKKYDPSIEVISMPLADGGDGSLDILKTHIEAEEKSLLVKDPLGRSIQATYLLCGEQAYIELSAASGLELLQHEERNPLYTSTFGTGELILDALSFGAKEIYLFVGGSATNDMGIGMAQALGFIFLDRDKMEVPPVGISLGFIMKIRQKLKFDPEEIKFFALCDVENPLYGKDGAAFVYAPQKGADKYAAEILNKGLKKLSRRCKKDLGVDIAKIPGSGAAGGVGGGVLAFFNGELISGADFLIQKTGLEKHLSGVDLIISGEGSFDEQSLAGKLVGRIANLCKKENTDLAILCGEKNIEKDSFKQLHIQSILDIMSLAKNRHDAISNAQGYLEQLTLDLLTELNFK